MVDSLVLYHGVVFLTQSDFVPMLPGPVIPGPGALSNVDVAAAGDWAPDCVCQVPSSASTWLVCAGYAVASSAV